ncbi:MAG TPA: glycosyltransferase family A protein [Candidatus Elarobacter sp.]|nr:glycosyltransferase family A protein [Candidatus Elarobacter sp.]
MSGSAPLFSVVVATYNRGRHIEPTLQSALEQRFRDFEVIVVGDGCTDDTMDVVRSFGSPRISAYELATNSGSQSAPNNAGIAHARGRYIAYLGHDDVWQPDHLAAIADVVARGGAPDVVASGCVFHGPPNSGISFVTGLLDDEHPASEHFLPPSALAHTRELVERIGRWRQPGRVSAPVDCDVMLRALRAGATFASTGRITVHKYAAGHRYLSYLRPESAEQRAMLWSGRSFAAADTCDFLVAAARRQDRYMTMTYLDYGLQKPGHLYRENRSNKGLRRPRLRALTKKTVLAQTAEPRGLDWHALEQSVRPYRWSGPNPKPRLLIPFKGDCNARLTLHILAGTPDEVLDAISFDRDGETLPHVVIAAPPQGARIEVELPLDAGDYSVLGITTTRMVRPADRVAGGDTRVLGIALGDVEIEPTCARSVVPAAGTSHRAVSHIMRRVRPRRKQTGA